MGNSNRLQETSVEHDVAHIDRLADAFEQHWTETSIDRLDEWLATLPADQKLDLIREIFHLEFEISFKRGRRLELSDLIERFPCYARTIRSVHEKLMRSRQLGEYEYYESLGKGGMGHVYRGRHRLLERQVAIKVLNRKVLDLAGGVERFHREIRLSGQLRHPNIVSAEYAGKADDRYYLVMELIAGEDVRKLVMRQGPLAIPVACEIIRQAATGLQYAFENGFVHRDIKPGNLMVSSTGTVKIIDFGLGKFAPSHHSSEASLTTLGMLVGSIDYMAPEQVIDATSATIQSDIFSLGCVMFFLLTGSNPFDIEWTRTDRQRLVLLKQSMPSLAAFCKNLPPELESLYQKMVAPDPRDRFEQPAAIVDSMADFSSSSDGDFVLAGTKWGDVPTRRFEPKHPAQDAASQDASRQDATRKRLLTLLLLTVVFGVGVYESIRLASWKRGNNAPANLGAPVAPTPHDDQAVNAPPFSEPLQHVGYSSKWWFEEVPFLLPVVREQIAVCEKTSPDSAAPSIPIISDATQHLLDFLKTHGSTLDNIADLEILSGAYFSDLDTKATHTATELHTRAVLLHRMALLRGDPILERRAIEVYEKAILHYNDDVTTISCRLVKLCQFDLARLQYEISGNPSEFQQQVNRIETDQRDDFLFRIHLAVVPALERMREGHHEDTVIEQSIQILESLDQTTGTHPMLSRLQALYAHALAYQWRMEIAERHWQKAEQEAVRWAETMGNSHQEAQLCDHAIQAKLAWAASARYLGDLNTARYRYRSVIGSLQDPFENLPNAPTERDRLKRQLAEAWEGLADTTLFVPTYFEKDTIPNAAFFIGEAESGYQQAADIVTDPVFRFVMRCKTTLLQCHAAEINETDRRSLLNDIREEFQTLSKGQVGFIRAREYNFLIEAVLESPNPVLSIRSYLDRKRLIVSPFARYAGERLDLQLLAIRTLLLADKATLDSDSLQQDRKNYLDPILMQHLAPARSLRPYLLPFYDLAIRLTSHDDVVSTAASIWMMRCRRYADSLSNVQLVFYFPMGEAEGFALVLSSDLQSNRRFDLGMNRKQVFELAKSGKKVALPPDLVEQVNAAWRRGEIVEVSWDDSCCWTASQEKNRLTEKQWPFDTSLDPNRLFGTARE